MTVNPLISVEHGRHGIEHGITPYQLLAAAQAHIGQRIKLPRNCDITSIRVEDGMLAIAFDRYDAEVLARETRLTARHNVLTSWQRTPDGWVEGPTYEAVDTTFAPHVVNESGRRVRDVNEQLERRAFEGDCFRPGTNHSPMDNAARVAEGYTTDQMARHWNA